MSWFEHGLSRINYEDTGSGAPVLMLPGWSMPIEGFAPLRQSVAAAGYRVIAVDLPGAGRSLPQPRQYTASYFEDDAHALLDLLGHLGVGPAHVLGFSDGGEYGLLMAEMAPAALRSLLTWGAVGKFSDPSGQLRQAMYNLVDHPIPPMQAFRDYLVGNYGEANARVMSQSMIGALGDIIDHRGGDLSWANAARIQCPVLLVAGEHDMFFPFSDLTQLAALIPTAQALQAPGAGHDVHNAKPEWFTGLVLDWLKKN